MRALASIKGFIGKANSSIIFNYETAEPVNTVGVRFPVLVDRLSRY